MSDSEEEEIRVTRFKHKGVDYLKSADNILYDPKTSEAVGYWNAETNEMEELAEFGSDEESEDEESEDDDDDDDEMDPELREILEAQQTEREPTERTPAQLAAAQKFGDRMIAGFLAEALAGIGRGKSPNTPVPKLPLPPVLTPAPAPPNTSSEAEAEIKKRCPRGTRRDKKTGLCKGGGQSKSFLPNELLSFADFKAKLK